MLPPSLSSPSVHHGVMHRNNVRQKKQVPSTEIAILWRKSHGTEWAICGRIKNILRRNTAVQIRRMSQSVSEDVASQDAVGGQHVERGVGVVIGCPNVVPICPPIAAISAPKTISRLSRNAGVSTFGLANANGFNVTVVEQRGWVRFPAVVEVPRLTSTVVECSWREIWVA